MLVAYVVACLFAGAILSYIVEGGPLWLALLVAGGIAVPTVVVGWTSWDSAVRLGHEWRRARSGQRASELGEDRQVGVEPDALKPPDSER